MELLKHNLDWALPLLVRPPVETAVTHLSHTAGVYGIESVHAPHSTHPPNPMPNAALFPCRQWDTDFSANIPKGRPSLLQVYLLSPCCFFCTVMCYCLFLSSPARYDQQNFLVFLRKMPFRWFQSHSHQWGQSHLITRVITAISKYVWYTHSFLFFPHSERVLVYRIGNLGTNVKCADSWGSLLGNSRSTSKVAALFGTISGKESPLPCV